jgi:hypothetical protein
MTITHQEEQTEEVVPFRVITGGKEPPKKGDNWLGKLSLWTYFVAMNETLSPIDAFLYQIVDKQTNCSWLRLIQHDKESVNWVPNEGFSDRFTLLDIIEKGEDVRGGGTNPDRRLEVVENIEQDDTVA